MAERQDGPGGAGASGASGGEDRRTRVLVAVGTRPEAIKMVPVIRALRASTRLRPLVVSTGQHRELLAEVFDLAGIRPDVDLAVGEPGLPLNHLFARVLSGLQEALAELLGPADSVAVDGPSARYPAWALVHGDTSSAAAVALAAFHLRMPVAHVEAGLRTHRTATPFPEELNRQLVARIAAFHLAPTSLNEENLILEGVRHEQVFVTGNTAVDALLWASATTSASARPSGRPEVDALLADPGRRIVVVTAHRRENLATGALGHVAAALAQVAAERPDTAFVLPLHPNPAVRAQLRPALDPLPNVLLTEPLPYPVFAALLGRAVLVVTDSGGVQEEAPALGVPVLVTRESTERTEGVDAGTLRLVGTETGAVAAAVRRLLDDDGARAAMAAADNPYGDGHAAERIVAALEHLTFRTPKPARFGSGYRRASVLRAAGFDEAAIHRAERAGA
ncbi:non-hydrolyzing UDP-N-acetylglucosamine 2-epimerase [Kitasatospora phosalacinea]|uniref:UDP-N-acetylglucosamine 2-epimerase (non-hydrolyzing) n=1 Tax=Kitasatospora phosalacinea TaxID=2065 RepID=A0A9W6PBG5_9ACTN|nr:UDP-N-acetylglucosamine 2-epimerase (non-hydrolyzing) [Kitasatospora phosalacinea]GLW52056.1 UDP-N-acetyl glucosamine 2-epimerase [Kitasatospora phosalacinea]